MSDATQRKLIDRIVQQNDGPLLGLLATTFELQSDFLETDFLPSLLGVGAWDDRGWATRVAMERELSKMEAAVVFLDARRYRGRPQSFRLQVRPLLPANAAAFHPKVALLVYEDAVRLLVGSANLTEPGYRRNREVAAALRATEKTPDAAPLILQALAGLREALQPQWNDASERVVALATERLTPFAPRAAEDEQSQFVWSRPGLPLWRRFVDAWPAAEQIQSLTIVSPFWSEELNESGPLTTLLRELRDRRLLAEGAELRILTDARPVASGQYCPVLPESYATLDLRSWNVDAAAYAVSPAAAEEDADDSMWKDAIRVLHAKVVVAAGRRTTQAYLGSANFTAPGWGFADGRANVEAGLILLATGRDRAALAALLPSTIGAPVPLAGAAAGKLALPMAGELEPPWPTFVRDIELRPRSAGARELELRVTVVESLVAGEWRLELAGRQLLRAGTGGEHTIALDGDLLAALLRRKEVDVHWWASDQPVGFPVNVSQDARDELPIMPGAVNPAESTLLAYYQGRISWEELFPETHAGGDGAEDAPPTAPQASVDTSRIRSYQIREFVEALHGLQEDLKKAATASAPAMRQALLGAISPLALARQVVEAVRQRRRTSMAAAFQLIEILCCIGRARAHAPEGTLATAWAAAVDKAIVEIEGLLEEVERESVDDLSEQRAFQRYKATVSPAFRRQGVA